MFDDRWIMWVNMLLLRAKMQVYIYMGLPDLFWTSNQCTEICATVLHLVESTLTFIFSASASPFLFT
jgi:hypothetical protein